MSQAGAVTLPEPSHAQLPRWRGFNLLEKFWWNGQDTPFVERDFEWMSQWGFNFARLPMSYHFWIADGNWRKFRELPFQHLDQVVEWGQQYGVHINFNFHRAPGYTVASPKEEKNLWVDAEAQEVCALHWATFAKRYKGIPNARLSFDLLNEPAGTSNENYAKVAKILVDAIRVEDPNRLIIADGNNYGNVPVPELVPLRVAQSTRGYAPFQLTHYKASWVGDNSSWPVPTWPVKRGLSPYLYGDGKKDFQSPLVVKADFSREAQLRIRVQTVSDRSTLVVRANGRKVFEKEFICGDGRGEWKKSEFKAEWGIYQNLFDRFYSAVIPEGTKEVAIENTQGDWMTISEIRIEPYGEAERVVLRVGAVEWGRRQETFELDAHGNIISNTTVLYDRARHWREQIEPWKALEALGVGVHVGEWGSYQHTPHEVTLAWMRDCLANWKEAGWGWALWNLRGSFGLVDSGRKDVKYENFQGHKLDRAMLEVLQAG